jgi:hypothetical protein
MALPEMFTSADLLFEYSANQKKLIWDLIASGGINVNNAPELMQVRVTMPCF